ncbi:MAG: hypothetical protein ACTHKF_07120, partial [Candidatus Nitrosocosmicus sp.]
PQIPGTVRLNTIVQMEMIRIIVFEIIKGAINLDEYKHSYSFGDLIIKLLSYFIVSNKIENIL